MAGVPPINTLPQQAMARPVSQTDPRILAARMQAFRLAMYRTYNAYYNGQHRLAFASEKFRSAFGRLFFQFADNLCPCIVDSMADRMSIIDFTAQKGPDTLGKTAWDFWVDQKMPRKTSELHKETLRCGDGYVIVWPDPDSGLPCIYPQITEQIVPFYDDEVPGKMLWAAKAWQNPDQFIRLNMYYPDRIEKWITVKKMASMPTKPGYWTKFVVPGESWPLHNQWGQIPVFHFANNTHPGKFGKSELKDAMPMQDALNKSVIDMLVAMEYAALPQRWMVGVELEVDENTGLPVLPFQPSIDRVWTVADREARMGQFDAANLSQLIQVQENMRLEIARVTRTPLHLMMPAEIAPSGDALKVLEDPLVKKVEDRMLHFGDVWCNVMLFALQMQNLAGKTDALGVKWANPAPKSSLEDAQTLQIKQTIGVSTNQCLEEMGYTETEIEEMQADNDAETKKKQAQGVLPMPGLPPSDPSQRQPPGNTSQSVSPHADKQRISASGTPTTKTP
jgi:hypothetical protein